MTQMVGGFTKLKESEKSSAVAGRRRQSLPAMAYQKIYEYGWHCLDESLKAIDLSSDTHDKYVDALRVMKRTTAKAAWQNDDWYWMRVKVGSDEYMQALADHFEIVDKDDKMRILRKPKSLPSPLIDQDTDRQPGAVGASSPR